MSVPWYLRSPESDLVIDANGSVQAATVPVLVERLTTHETSDPAFVKTFLLTYKSFMTLDELFSLLVLRFDIKAPNNLTTTESEQWKRLKQHVVQSRVLDIVEALLTDDVFESDDAHILPRVKEFLQREPVSTFAASKRMLVWIDHVQPRLELNLLAPSNPVSVPGSTRSLTNTLGLLDIDPLELAQQLTLVESQLYQQIRPAECLARSQGRTILEGDNIARIIQFSNNIASWVADTVLSQNDPAARGIVLKQFILVADTCRSLQNYSSMVAIISGLNSPVIHRLKYSWDQVDLKTRAQMAACETLIDTVNKFTQYNFVLSSIVPPCVPFIGIFLTALASARDGSEDMLPGNMVNFRKRREISTIIQDILHWKVAPYQFHTLPPIQAYIDESLGKFADQTDSGAVFWKLSLEREPGEDGGEMVRLLQEVNGQ